MNTGKKFKTLIFCLCIGFICPPELMASEVKHNSAVDRKPDALNLLAACARMIPLEPLALNGELIVRKQRGIELARHPFKLMTDWGASPPAAECLLFEEDEQTVAERAMLIRSPNADADIKVFKGLDKKSPISVSMAGRVRGSDMTWMDLTLDFLWWKDVRFDNEPEGDCRIGRACHILLAAPPRSIPGCSALRIWVDKQLKCIMQTEQLNHQGESVRRMWVQRVKKMDDRWMIRHMEIESVGSGHRTKLLIDDVVRP